MSAPHGSLHGGGDVFHADAQAARLAGDEDDGGGEAFLILVHLVGHLNGQLFREIDDGVFRVLGQVVEVPAGLLHGLGGDDVQAQGLESHHALPVAQHCDLIHRVHAAFPGSRRREDPPDGPS